eukprot:9022928-Alexandrium_andersonii.AAC.1
MAAPAESADAASASISKGNKRREISGSTAAVSEPTPAAPSPGAKALPPVTLEPIDPKPGKPGKPGKSGTTAAGT